MLQMGDLYPSAVSLPSSHCDLRPDCNDISLLVIHNISLPPGKFGGKGIRDLFLGQLNPDDDPFYQQIASLRVSAHCVIQRDGTIEQYVPFDQRAWHAGVSSFQGREKCNDYSIGIEMEGTDLVPYTDQQYYSLMALTGYILKRYPAITVGRIVGHNDIAPGRKTDPGPAFDWARYRQGIWTYLRGIQS